MVFIYLRQEPPRSTMGAQRAPRSQQNLPGASMSCYNWCSGASQMNNSWQYMILQTFLTVVKCYLVSTRALVLESLFYVYFRKWCWDWFCRLLEPWPESHQIELPGTGFVDFWSHGRKVIKSSLLGLVLSTSGAMAGKSSNRASWDWFCRLLEPLLKSH